MSMELTIHDITSIKVHTRQHREADSDLAQYDFDVVYIEAVDGNGDTQTVKIFTTELDTPVIIDPSEEI